MSTETAEITVTPVTSYLGRVRFVDFLRTLYKRDPHFVPPISAMVLAQLDDKKHPYFQHATQRLFLASRGRRVVGRIAAYVDEEFNRHHQSQTGMVGYFDFEDDPAVSGALLQAAVSHLREQGMTQVLGPIQLSTNYEAGLLVEGHGMPPCIMMTYNAPYYETHFERAGFEKAKDLMAWQVTKEELTMDRVKRIAGKVLKRSGIEIRPIQMRHFAQEAAKIQDVYNRAWEKNWGFVPLTDAEFRLQVKELKRLLRAELCQIAEKDGEAIAFALAVPDANQAIKKIRGKLFPFGIFRLPFLLNKIDHIRVITLGVVPEARSSGLEAPLLVELIESGLEAGYVSSEMSWVLEDNLAMNRGMEAIGGNPYKRYRIYEAAPDRILANISS